MLARCEEIRRATGGYFDAWATGTLDPSGLVKGWSVETASGMLVERGSASHCINAGGEIRLRGEPEPGRPWHAGIAHPLVPGALTVIVAGRDLAAATSGTAERGQHVIDPHDRRPAAALASVTVVGPELRVTDSFATAAVAMGIDAPEWLDSLEEHEAYVIDAGGHVWWTAGFARYAPALATTPRPRLTHHRPSAESATARSQRVKTAMKSRELPDSQWLGPYNMPERRSLPERPPV